MAKQYKVSLFYRLVYILSNDEIYINQRNTYKYYQNLLYITTLIQGFYLLWGFHFRGILFINGEFVFSSQLYFFFCRSDSKTIIRNNCVFSKQHEHPLLYEFNWSGVTTQSLPLRCFPFFYLHATDK